MIHRLLEAGADPNTADYNGDTPLIKAIWMTTSSNIEKSEITKICKELIRAGKLKIDRNFFLYILYNIIK